MRRLMILEVSQKQAYIFASRRLRENAARSEDIRYVTESRFFQRAAGPLYREEEDLVYAGGGHTVLQFDSRARADAFARAVTEAAIASLRRATPITWWARASRSCGRRYSRSCCGRTASRQRLTVFW